MSKKAEREDMLARIDAETDQEALIELIKHCKAVDEKYSYKHDDLQIKMHENWIIENRAVERLHTLLGM